MAGEALLDRYDDAVMKNSLKRHGQVHDFRADLLKEGEEEAFGGLGHPAVFLGRDADDGGGVDRVPAAGDALEVEYRVFIFKRIKAGVVTKRAFKNKIFGRVNKTFDNKIGIRRYFQVVGDTFYKLNLLLSQKSGKEIFVKIIGHGCGCSVGVNRVTAQNYRYRHFFS